MGLGMGLRDRQVPSCWQPSEGLSGSWLPSRPGPQGSARTARPREAPGLPQARPLLTCWDLIVPVSPCSLQPYSIPVTSASGGTSSVQVLGKAGACEFPWVCLDASTAQGEGEGEAEGSPSFLYAPHSQEPPLGPRTGRQRQSQLHSLNSGSRSSAAMLRPSCQ